MLSLRLMMKVSILERSTTGMGARAICFCEAGAIANELNPLIMSHPAITISYTAIGRAKTVKELPKMPSKPVANINAAPMRPQADNHRGMSFD
jgi:hypothetical protein